MEGLIRKDKHEQSSRITTNPFLRGMVTRMSGLMQGVCKKRLAIDVK
jgi:hypothetical protein